MHSLEIASAQNVDGPDHDRAPGPFDSFYGLLRRRPILGRIKLIPDRTAASVHYLLDRLVALLKAAENLKRLLLLRGSSNGQGAFGMKQCTARRKRHRRFPLRSEQIDAHIDLCGVDQAARPQLIVREPFEVCS